MWLEHLYFIFVYSSIYYLISELINLRFLLLSLNLSILLLFLKCKLFISLILCFVVFHFYFIDFKLEFIVSSSLLFRVVCSCFSSLWCILLSYLVEISQIIWFRYFIKQIVPLGLPKIVGVFCFYFHFILKISNFLPWFSLGRYYYSVMCYLISKSF